MPDATEKVEWLVSRGLSREEAHLFVAELIVIGKMAEKSRQYETESKHYTARLRSVGDD